LIVDPDAVNDVGGVTPSTVPKETVPTVPPIKLRLLPPVTVLVKVILAPAGVPLLFVVSATTFPFNVTGPVKVMMPPLVVILLPKLIAVDPV
jgi:hypothetical protein